MPLDTRLTSRSAMEGQKCSHYPRILETPGQWSRKNSKHERPWATRCCMTGLSRPPRQLQVGARSETNGQGASPALFQELHMSVDRVVLRLLANSVVALASLSTLSAGGQIFLDVPR